MKRYWVESYGCQMSVHDGERLAGLLEEDGYEPAASAGDADVVVVNTCSVRERAEEKLYTRLGEIREESRNKGRDPVVAVAGCVAQQQGAALRARSAEVDVVIGTQSLRQLPHLVSRAASVQNPHAPLVDTNPYEDVSFPFGVTRRLDPVKAYVTIIEGCNDFCSFCIVPYTRGHERMRASAEIVEEVRAAAAEGRKEIHLLGQIVNHYRDPERADVDFARLLELVHEVPGVERIRFASPHPRHVSDRMIAAMRDLPKVCRHLHLPVQSGSSRVLKAMRRRYTRESYLELVDRLRAAMPDLAISTDMIVGFPGETVEDFEATLSLTATVRYSSMFSFKYSPRPFTLATKRLPDDVPEPEKTRRIVELQQLQRQIQQEIHEAAVGRTFEVLVDGPSRRRPHEMAGRTTGNTIVNFPGQPDCIGRTLPVRIRRAGPNSLWGEPVLDSPGSGAYV